GGASVELHEGDVIMFPQGDAHVISSAPGMRVAKVDKAFFFSPKPAQLPYVLLQRGERTLAAPIGDRSRKPSPSDDVRGRPDSARAASAIDGVPSVAVEQADRMTARLDGGGTEHATVVCGFLGCDERPFNPLLAALPR